MPYADNQGLRINYELEFIPLPIGIHAHPTAASANR
jgi:hypothetical protein